MPVITFRLSDRQAQDLRDRASRRGVSVSSLIKEGLGLGEVQESSDLSGMVEDHERRLSRLEEMAYGR